MKQQARTAFIRLLVLLALASLACGAGLPGLPDFGATATAEPVPTPVGDTLAFRLPTYTIQLAPGERVPGTALQYVDRRGETYLVNIDGLEAARRPGDSLIWNGIVAPGVYGNFNLRLTTAVSDLITANGSTELIIFNPLPAEQPLPPNLEPRLRYDDVAINYTVPVGWSVPGTTLVYEGLQAPGPGSSQQLARLSGTTGYPFLAVGDSLVWIGRLRPNVYVRYDLRTQAFDADRLRLLGTADLLITP